MPYVSFLFICLVWGASFILMKKGAVWFSPAAIGAWRVIGGAAILGLVCWWTRLPWGLRRGDLPGVAFVGGCGFAWAFWVQPFLGARFGVHCIALTVRLPPFV